MNFETPQGYQDAQKPEDLKNALFIAQAMLMGRSPTPEAEWTETYSAKFRKLFDTNEEFRDLLLKEMNNETLRTLQEMLDKEA